MSDDERDLALLQQEDGAPTEAHDRAVLDAIDKASARIAARKARRTGLAWIALPTALAASVLLVPFLLPERVDPAREIAAEAAVYPANAAELAAPPAELRWQALPDASAYRVTLRDSGGRALVEQTIPPAAGVFVLPADVRGELSPGGTYFWTVGVDDSLQRELGPFWFSLADSTSPGQR